MKLCYSFWSINVNHFHFLKFACSVMQSHDEEARWNALFLFRLDDLNKECDVNCITLIEKMVSSKPSERPSTSAILKHPFYWNPEKVLGFFQVRTRPGDHISFFLYLLYLKYSKSSLNLIQIIKKFQLSVLCDKLLLVLLYIHNWGYSGWEDYCHFIDLISQVKVTELSAVHLCLSEGHSGYT